MLVARDVELARRAPSATSSSSVDGQRLGLGPHRGRCRPSARRSRRRRPCLTVSTHGRPRVTVGDVTRNSAPPLNSMPSVSLQDRAASTIETTQQDGRDGVPDACAARRSRRRPRRGRAGRRAVRAGTSGLLLGWRCAAATARRRRRPAVRRVAPEPLGVEPGEAGARSPKNFVRASSVTSGLVNRNTTTMSISVVSPRVNANPRTPPTERKYRTTAARKRHEVGGQDRAPGPHPAVSTATRSVRPRAPRRVVVRSRR